MTIHSVSFSLYILTIVIFYVFYFYFIKIEEDAANNERQKKTRICLMAWISTTCTNFIAQLCLIWIFMQFRQKEEQAPKLTNKEIDEFRYPSVVRLDKFESELHSSFKTLETDTMHVTQYHPENSNDVT